jgi:hypothetical protein
VTTSLVAGVGRRPARLRQSTRRCNAAPGPLDRRKRRRHVAERARSAARAALIAIAQRRSGRALVGGHDFSIVLRPGVTGRRQPGRIQTFVTPRPWKPAGPTTRSMDRTACASRTRRGPGRRARDRRVADVAGRVAAVEQPRRGGLLDEVGLSKTCSRRARSASPTCRRSVGGAHGSGEVTLAAITAATPVITAGS